MQESIRQQMEENMVLLINLIESKKQFNETKSRKSELYYNKCFNDAINKFSYIVEKHTNRYKKYSNYEDLFQEGLFGLTMALNKYDPNRSKNFFKFANWYIKTRVIRAANKFNTINIPMHVAKQQKLSKINELPILVDKEKTPYEEMEYRQLCKNIKDALKLLSDIQKRVVCSFFGLGDYNNNEKGSIITIAKQMKMPATNVEEILKEAYAIMLKSNKITGFEP